MINATPDRERACWIPEVVGACSSHCAYSDRTALRRQPIRYQHVVGQADLKRRLNLRHVMLLRTMNNFGLYQAWFLYVFCDVVFVKFRVYLLRYWVVLEMEWLLHQIYQNSSPILALERLL